MKKVQKKAIILPQGCRFFGDFYSGDFVDSYVPDCLCKVNAKWQK